VGALISEQHMHKVLHYIDRGAPRVRAVLTGGMRVTTAASTGDTSLRPPYSMVAATT